MEWEKKNTELIFLPCCWLSLYTFEKHHKHLAPIEILIQADPNNACGFGGLFFSAFIQNLQGLFFICLF